jgi:hypothetical protein
MDEVARSAEVGPALTDRADESSGYLPVVFLVAVLQSAGLRVAECVRAADPGETMARFVPLPVGE